VDGASRVVFANAAARALLSSSGGLALEAGCLRSTDDSDALLQGLIVSCKRKAHTRNGPGDSRRPAPVTTCNSDTAAGQRHRRGTSLARLANSRGHCHGIRSLDGKITHLSAPAIMAEARKFREASAAAVRQASGCSKMTIDSEQPERAQPGAKVG
jgi:hypothetical protein